MAKKVLIINGSLRVRGNTDTLIANLVKGTKNTGTRVRHYFLRDKKIARVSVSHAKFLPLISYISHGKESIGSCCPTQNCSRCKISYSIYFR